MFDGLLYIGLFHYLGLSLILFLLGLLGVIISRNLLRIIMSLFVLSIAIALNFAAFGYYCDNTLETSNIMSVFVLLITMFQAIIAIVIMYKIYESNEYLDSEKIKDKEG